MLGKVGPASAGSSEDDAGGRRHTLLPWRLLTRELIMMGADIALASHEVAVPGWEGRKNQDTGLDSGLSSLL